MTWLLFAPLISALVAAFLSRWVRLAAVWGLITAVGLWLLLRSEPAVEQSVTLLNYTLRLTPQMRMLCMFLYAGLSLLFTLAIIFPQGGKLVPASLAAVGLLVVAMMMRPPLLGVVLMTMGLALLAISVQDDRAGLVQGGLRYLALAVLALPFLLVASWLADTQTAATPTNISRLALPGVLILLAAFPFHIWATTVLREASPLAWLLLFGLAQLAVTLFLFGLVNVGLDGEMMRVVELTAVLTLLVAFLLLLTAVTLNRLIGGLLLVDMAAVLLLLLADPVVRWDTAVTIQTARVFTLALLAVGFLLWRSYGGGALATVGEGTARPMSQGLGRSAPLTMIVLLFGCLSLAGLPLTIGFGGRWLVIQWLVDADFGGLALLLLATMGAGMMALLRGVFYWLATAEEAATRPRETRWRQWVLSAVLLMALWLAWQSPTWLLNP
jgi:NADH:ubiquinone oxidoreductase subunit 2 (subunit N)